MIVQWKQQKWLQRPSQQKHKVALETLETCQTRTKHHPHTQYAISNVLSRITHVKQGLEHSNSQFSPCELAASAQITAIVRSPV